MYLLRKLGGTARDRFYINVGMAIEDRFSGVDWGTNGVVFLEHTIPTIQLIT